MTDLIGHNNPPIETAADLPAGMPKMHYFKCDIAAARKATFDKPLDVRGAFWSAMLAMYEYMEPLPADDSMAQMRLGIKDVRTYRAVKKIMLNLGMLYQLPSGRLSNQRFEDEIAAYVTEFRNRQEAAKIREEKARVARGTRGNRPGIDRESTSNRPRIDLKSPANRPPIEDRLNVDLSKKTNENKGATTTIVPERTPQTDHEAPLRARVLELELDSKGKKERNTGQPETPPESLRAGGQDDLGELPGLNGSTSAIVRTIATWIAPFGCPPDINTARRTVGEAIQHYGAEAVRDGFVDYKSDMDDGKVRVPSLKGLYGFIRQAKNRPPKAARPSPSGAGRPRTYRPTHSDLAEAVAELEGHAEPPIIEASFTRIRN